MNDDININELNPSLFIEMKTLDNRITIKKLELNNLEHYSYIYKNFSRYRDVHGYNKQHKQLVMDIHNLEIKKKQLVRKMYMHVTIKILEEIKHLIIQTIKSIPSKIYRKIFGIV